MSEFLSGLYSWMFIGGALLFFIACSLIGVALAMKGVVEVCLWIAEKYNKHRYRKELLAVRMKNIDEHAPDQG